MCETETILARLSVIVLLAASFCINQAQTMYKVGHQSKIKNQCPRKRAQGVLFQRWRMLLSSLQSYCTL